MGELEIAEQDKKFSSNKLLIFLNDKFLFVTARTILRTPGGVTVHRLVGVSRTSGNADLWFRNQTGSVPVLGSHLESTFSDTLRPSGPMGPTHCEVQKKYDFVAR